MVDGILFCGSVLPTAQKRAASGEMPVKRRPFAVENTLKGQIVKAGPEGIEFYLVVHVNS